MGDVEAGCIILPHFPWNMRLEKRNTWNEWRSGCRITRRAKWGPHPHPWVANPRRAVNPIGLYSQEPASRWSSGLIGDCPALSQLACHLAALVRRRQLNLISQLRYIYIYISSVLFFWIYFCLERHDARRSFIHSGESLANFLQAKSRWRAAHDGLLRLLIRQSAPGCYPLPSTSRVARKQRSTEA